MHGVRIVANGAAACGTAVDVKTSSSRSLMGDPKRSRSRCWMESLGYFGSDTEPCLLVEEDVEVEDWDRLGSCRVAIRDERLGNPFEENQW